MADFVRTRFAPSPTGYLHVGGARTALFNYLLARRLGGKFILRIEDTDQTRNIERADEKLMEDLRWLGLRWDEGPQLGGPAGSYYQSQRLEQYRRHAQRLLDEGRAYYAFDTPAELEAMRTNAARRKQNFRYPRPARFPSQADADRARGEGRPVVVRFRMPERAWTINDQILGEVSIGADELDDFVIVKSDGWPTYHFAVVVDDQQMLVTHVLRGQEHLLNTARHVALQEAFGYVAPAYAHLPIILNLDGSKMSKREKGRVVLAAFEAATKSGALDAGRAMEIAGVGDAALFDAWRRGDTQFEGAALARLAQALNVQAPEIEIHDFRASGYLPEVLVNFIALLGWSPGDGREKFTLAELCETFSVERIGKTNARFDRAKLLNFNTTALAAAPMERKLAGLRDWLSVNDPGPLTTLDDATLTRLLGMCEGLRIFRDVETKCAALFVDEGQLRYDADAVQQVLIRGGGAGLGVLREMRSRLEALPNWSVAALEALIRGHTETAGLGLGKVAQPLRVAVAGTTVSPAIFDTLALLGRERTLRRIDRAIALAESVAAPAE
jgi:glutamyl-tRNA synthetase